MACLEVTVASDAKTRVEDDLAKVLDALVDVEEDECRLEAEISRLTVE